jgi:hypothetical protein
MVVAWLTLQRGTSASLLLQFIVRTPPVQRPACFATVRSPRAARTRAVSPIHSGICGWRARPAAGSPPCCRRLIFPDTWEYPLALFAAAVVALVVVLADPATDRDSPLSSLGWSALVAVGVGLRTA